MNVYLFECKRLIKSMAIWTIVCGLCIVLFMAFYPSMQGMNNMLSEEMKAIPETMLQAVNLDGVIDFSKFEDYIMYVIQYLSMAVGIYGGILGANSLIQEESSGYIEFLYSKPIKREKILLYKLLSILTIFIFFIAILFICTLIISVIVKSNNDSISNIVSIIGKIYIGNLFLGIIFLAVGVLLSTVIKTAKQAIPLALGIFFLSYILGILSRIKEDLKFLKYFSPMDYAIPSDLLDKGFEMKYIIVGLILIILSITIAMRIYSKKDFKI